MTVQTQNEITETNLTRVEIHTPYFHMHSMEFCTFQCLHVHLSQVQINCGKASNRYTAHSQKLLYTALNMQYTNTHFN
jgi:hypothetical protein